jgi:hypothetical protein
MRIYISLTLRFSSCMDHFFNFYLNFFSVIYFIDKVVLLIKREERLFFFMNQSVSFPPSENAKCVKLICEQNSWNFVF